MISMPWCLKEKCSRDVITVDEPSQFDMFSFFRPKEIKRKKIQFGEQHQTAKEL